MRTTIDKVGRVVIPLALRRQAGLVPGEVEVTADGTGLRIEPVAGEGLADDAGLLVIPAEGPPLDADDVRALRDADRR